MWPCLIHSCQTFSEKLVLKSFHFVLYFLHVGLEALLWVLSRSAGRRSAGTWALLCPAERVTHAMQLRLPFYKCHILMAADSGQFWSWCMVCILWVGSELVLLLVLLEKSQRMCICNCVVLSNRQRNITLTLTQIPPLQPKSIWLTHCNNYGPKSCEGFL